MKKEERKVRHLHAIATDSEWDKIIKNIDNVRKAEEVTISKGDAVTLLLLKKG